MAKSATKTNISNLKLHLGCGEIYLDGYINIDYPLTKHTAQQTTVADKFADLTKLHYKKETVDEVRLHHVFEHFPRTMALALLSSWHSWLKMDGRIQIEVPDFDATAKIVLSRRSKPNDRKVAIRHIFGSNEAPWAVHYDGWSKSRLHELFTTFGFSVESLEQSAYLGTRNVTIIGRKAKKTPSKAKLVKGAKEYLSRFNIDRSDTENRILDVWVSDFAKQLDATYAR